jgi:hypothetical protein
MSSYTGRQVLVLRKNSSAFTVAVKQELLQYESKSFSVSWQLLLWLLAMGTPGSPASQFTNS